MKIGRSIRIVLFVLCLLVASAQTAPVSAADDVSSLRDKIEQAITVLNVSELTTNPNAKFSARVNSAIANLKKAHVILSAAADRELAGQETGNGLKDAESSINEAIKDLSLANTLAKTETQDKIKPVRANLDAALASIRGLNPRRDAASSPSPTQTGPVIPPEEEGEGFLAEMLTYTVPLLRIGAVLLALGLLTYSVILVLGLRRVTGEYIGGVLPKTFSDMKARQDELKKQIEASAAVNKDINARLADVHIEIRQMSRMLQQTSLANNRQASGPSNYSQPAATPVSDMPVFPISADELLRQMHGKSVVVKRDFQNDMLVSDPDGKGELVLIRDSHIADEVQPLFVVPSVTQFQMRQEYYNFYEKYYECANPESGAVWIVDPAVVEKVAGGWQLREKGRLEIR